MGVIRIGDLVKQTKRNQRLVVSNITKENNEYVVEFKRITGFGRLKSDTTIKTKSLEKLSLAYKILDNFIQSLSKKLINKLNNIFNTKDFVFDSSNFTSLKTDCVIVKTEENTITSASELPIPQLKQVITFFELLERGV